MIAAAAALCVAISGCATIVNGTHQPVSFSSTPEGAEVFVDGASRGVTPTTVELSRQVSNAHVEFRKTGYEVSEETLHSQISGYYFLNLILGGVVGLSLDAIDGAWFGYDDSLHANLIPVAEASNVHPPVAGPLSSAPPGAGQVAGGITNPNADARQLDRSM